MLLGLAHSAICVPDVEAATRWYTEVLGFRLLSPPYRMEGADIERDMGELVPPPVVVKASIVGIAGDDRVIELIEYPEVPSTPSDAVASGSITRPGLTHVGLVCDDLGATRDALESAGVEFVTPGIAEVAGLRTTWLRDPWGVIFILMEKGAGSKPYWRQYGGTGTAS